MATIGEMINGTVFEEVTEENKLHRTNKIIERPSTKVELLSIYRDNIELVRTKKDPTEDLICLPKGPTSEVVLLETLGSYAPTGYVIVDTVTQQTWFAHDELCLNKNFIYREDLKITPVNSIEELVKVHSDFNAEWEPGVVTAKFCYILDNPGNETYEVYYDSTYPSLHYGKATPQGCFIHKYKNRFHRDMAILDLDNLYTNSSYKDAGTLADKELKKNEAIIVSDGAWMCNVCTSTFFYIDNDGIRKQSIARVPSDPDQAVLIAEVTGAYESLMMCYLNKKTNVTYYYDNTSIINVFNNRKTEYIDEVKKFKEFIKKLHEEGFDVNFVEIHPKTDENKDKENKALMFFHNSCDAECRLMSDIFKKDYKIYATMGNKNGKSLSDVSKGPTKKQGGNNGYRKPGNGNGAYRANNTGRRY